MEGGFLVSPTSAIGCGVINMDWDFSTRRIPKIYFPPSVSPPKIYSRFNYIQMGVGFGIFVDEPDTNLTSLMQTNSDIKYIYMTVQGLCWRRWQWSYLLSSPCTFTTEERFSDCPFIFSQRLQPWNFFQRPWKKCLFPRRVWEGQSLYNYTKTVCPMFKVRSRHNNYSHGHQNYHSWSSFHCFCLFDQLELTNKILFISQSVLCNKTLQLRHCNRWSDLIFHFL